MKFICIYCKKEKNKTDFNKEHVLTNCLNGSITLNNLVCKSCNGELGKKIDNHLTANGSFLSWCINRNPSCKEEILTIQNNRKNRRKADNRHNTWKNPESNKILEGELKDLIVQISNFKEITGIEPDIGIKKINSTYDWFKVDEIPDYNFYEARIKYDLASKKLFNFIRGEKDLELIIKKLEEKKWSVTGVRYGDYISSYFPNGECLGYSEFSITKNGEENRAIAKIVFNNLAYALCKIRNTKVNEILIDEAFDPIRNFVTKGTLDSSNEIFIRYSNDPIVRNSSVLDKGNRCPLIHIFVADIMQNGDVIARIRLYNIVTYEFFIFNINNIRSNENKELLKEVINSKYSYGINCYDSKPITIKKFKLGNLITSYDRRSLLRNLGFWIPDEVNIVKVL